MITEKSCGGVVYRRKNDKYEYLVVRSEENGHWGFPKGHVEDGENEQDTAAREIFEESGLEVDFHQGFREEMRYSLTEERDKVVVIFLAEAIDDRVHIQEKEISEYMWLQYDNVFEKISFENARIILSKAHKYLSKIE